jgi:hypothetical protein
MELTPNRLPLLHDKELYDDDNEQRVEHYLDSTT